jgi:hypothetical protein
MVVFLRPKVRHAASARMDPVERNPQTAEKRPPFGASLVGGFMEHDASHKDGGHQTKVLLIERVVVRQILTLLSMKWCSKRIAAELGVARNTVRRYARAEQAPQGAKAVGHTLRAGEAVATRARRFLRRRPPATRWWCSGCWPKKGCRAACGQRSGC